MVKHADETNRVTTQTGTESYVLFDHGGWCAGTVCCLERSPRFGRGEPTVLLRYRSAALDRDVPCDAPQPVSVGD